MKFLRLLKHNARYLCKFLIWTNFFVFFYLMIHIKEEEKIPVHLSLLEKEGVAKLLSEEALNVRSGSKYKFKDFNPENWNETQKFTLKDSSHTHFK